MDISEQIIIAKRKISEIERLIANPEMVSKKQIYEACISLEVTVQTMIARTVNYSIEE